MKAAKIVGIVLIALGLLGLVYGGIRYTTHESVVDVGPLHLSADREHSVPIAPIAGAVLVVAGAVALIVTSRRHGA